MPRNRIGHRGVCLAALTLLAPLQILAAASFDEGDPPLPARADAAPEQPGSLAAAIPPAVIAASPAFATGAPPATAALVTEAEVAPETPAPPPPPPAGAATSFAERFPAQAAARQDLSQPATTRWAVLVGINEHRGTVADNVGSRQDAEDLRAHLLASGWRDDNILLLTDGDATRANIVDGLAWLAARTDQDSVAVFHYSGHSKKWYDVDVDGDGEDTDEGLWPTDDRFIPDAELVQLLDPVRAGAFWISFATCNAAGLADPGMVRPGRILTFSSGEAQKSYEQPAWANSVWGWLMIEQALAAGVADADGDRRVTVEEAFAWARPRARDTTIAQRYGPQDAVIVDQLEGEFDLLVPGQPSRPGATVPAPEQPAPDGGQPREPTDDNDGNGICLFCSNR